MLIFQTLNAPSPMQKSAAAETFFLISCQDQNGKEKSTGRINQELSDAFRKIGYAALADLVRVSPPEGSTKKYTRIYLEMDQWVHIGGMKEGENTNLMSFADRAGRENIRELQISLVRAPGEAERLKLTIIYQQGGDPPDVLAISPSGHVSYSREIDGKLESLPNNNFQLGKAAKDDW
jgi:hypothetical protein